MNGEQYIAVVVGWGGAAPLIMGPDINPKSDKQNISRVLAYKLGANGQLPPKPPLPQRIAPPEDIGGDEQIAAGEMHYERYCAGCHGITAFSGGVLPDLRFSPMITDATVFRSVVLEGVRQERGMVSFAGVLGEADAEAIRLYVIRRANETAEP